jgi:anthranilate phosphoribosyltransferase
MLPSWVGVVSALSLAVIALAAIAVAAASIASALGVRTMVRLLEHLAGPAITDVRQLIATIKGEADALAGTSRDIRLRIVRAADAAEARLSDLDALVEVVQGEVEETAIDAAVTLRNMRRGLSLWQWGRKVLKGKRKP